jgi:hypothetical protein
MKEKDVPGIVPDQYDGLPIDTESSVELPDSRKAKTFFEEVKSRLKNVNEWHQFAGALTANFQLVDQEGSEVNRMAEKGDYFKINIPGPDNPGGDGADWVQIEEVESSSSPDKESFGFRVRPSHDPKINTNKTTHFYSPDTTSSFTVTRENNQVKVGIYDRNTKANTDAGHFTGNLRNAIVGTVGILAFSKFQWKSLTEGLLQK